MLVGIDFFDKDVVFTLIPIFSMKPDIEYLVCDKKDEKLVDSIVSAINIHENNNVDVRTVFVDGDNFGDIEQKLEDVLKNESKNEIYIDLTGGSELMNACGYKLGMKYNARLLHVNFNDMILNDVNSGQKVCDAVNISLYDYLEGIGAKRLPDSHIVPREDEYKDIVELAELFFKNVDAWKKLHGRIANRPKTYKNGFPKASFKNSEMIIINELLNRGYLINRKSMYEFRDDKAKEYLITYGIWLEMYIYIKAKELYDEVELGVVIDWNNHDGREGKDNEIDVIFMKNSIPVFISCKMTKPAPLDICEVGFLTKRLSSQKGEAIVATTSHIKEVGNENNKGIHYKMKELHVGCIEVREFLTKSTTQVFEDELKKMGVIR